MYEMYDAIVVGAGPAGSFCAENLAKEGLKVAIVEKRKHIGFPARCAGAISLHWLNKLKLEPPPITIEVEIKKVRIYSPDNNFIEAKLNKTLGYILNRALFDNWLFEKADKAGAETIKGEVLDVTPKGIEYRLDYTTRCILKGKYIVGADGPKSLVARQKGFKIPSGEDMHVGIQVTIENEDRDKDLISIHFDQRYTRLGYCWVFPESQGIRVGIGDSMDNRQNLKMRLNKFIKNNNLEGKIIDQTGNYIPTARAIRNYKDNVILIGSAGRFVCPLTGGGIATGMLSARAATQAILDNDLSSFNGYANELNSFLHKRYLMKQWLAKLDNNDFNTLTHLLEDFKITSLDPKIETLRLFKHLLMKKPLFVRDLVGLLF